MSKKKREPKTVRAAQRQFARDREHRAWSSRGTTEAAERRTPRVYHPTAPPAGPVTVTRADGTTTVVAPLNARDLQRILRLRDVSPEKRRLIEQRDDGRCRYCGTAAGPFEVDHVLPVALGGGNSMRNLVWSCDRCNNRKDRELWKPVPLAEHLRRGIRTSKRR